MAKRIRPSSYLFPIGMLIEVDNSNFDPNVFYCNGKWERIKGKVIVGVDESDSDFNVTGKIIGSKTHVLTQNELPNIKGTLPHQAYGEHKLSGVFNVISGQVLGYEGQQSTGQNYTAYELNVGNNQPHNNIQPSYTAYIWKLVSYS